MKSLRELVKKKTEKDVALNIRNNHLLVMRVLEFP